MSPRTNQLTGVVKAEWTKWTSTAMVRRYAGSGVLLSVAITGLVGLAMAQANAYCAETAHKCTKPPIMASNEIASAGVMGDGTPGAGLIALMLLGAACVLTEYRYGTVATAFLATPRRWKVFGAKALLTAVIAFSAAFIASQASVLVFSWIAGTAAASVDPWAPQTWGISARTALVVALAAVAAVGLAAAVRNSVGVVSLIVAWPLVIEPLLPSFVPGAADSLVAYLPFVNARYFIGLGGGGVDFPWGPGGAGVYFAVVAALVLAVGTATSERVRVP